MPLRSEMNYGNIRLRMTLKQMSGCLPLRSEMNYGNIRRSRASQELKLARNACSILATVAAMYTQCLDFHISVFYYGNTYFRIYNGFPYEIR